MGKTIIIKLLLAMLAAIICVSSTNANEKYIYTQLNSGNRYIPMANCIYKEKKLYVWMGTDKGAYRFDGAGYKLYTKDDANNFIPGDVVYGMFADGLDNFWIITNKGAGIYNRENDCFDTVKIDGVKDVNVFSFCLGDDGVYLGTVGGIYKYDYRKKKIELFYKIDSDDRFQVRFICFLPHGKLIFTNQMEICMLDIRNKECNFNFIELSTKLSCMYKDKNGRIWIATYNNGVKVFDNEGNEVITMNKDNSNLSSEVVLCMEEQDSLLWMGTDGGGINILDMKDNNITVLSHVSGNSNTLPSNSIKCLFNDDYGMMWAGSVRDGVINIQKGRINTYNEVNLGSPYGLSNPTVLNIYQDSNGYDLWIGTDGEGINKFNTKNATFTHYPATYKSKVASIAYYSENELLLELYLRGFYIFNKKTGMMRELKIDNEHINNKAFYTETTVNLVNEDENFILCVTDKIHRYDIKRACIEEIGVERGKAYGYFLLAGRNDNRLFFYDNKAIYSLKKGDSKLEMIYRIEQGNISTATFDKDGGFWIASGNRLAYYSLKTKLFSSIEQTLTNDISSIVAGYNDIVWIGAENQLYAYLKDENSFAIFGPSQGVKKNDYIKKPVLVTADGSVCMGGSRGLLVIDSDFRIDTKEVPEVILTEVRVDGNPLSLGQNSKKNEVEMSWDSKSIEIAVASLERDILRPKAYRFEVIGANNMVIESYKPVLILRSLLPGENHIYISCSTRKGLWTRPVELLSVDVLPPWYRTWWFLTMVIAVTFIAVLLVFYSMLRKKENAMKMAMQEHEKDIYEEKVRFLINMSHELRTPLTLIHAPLKRILEKMSTNDTYYVQLSKIYRQSGRMKRLLNMVLDLRRMEVGENTLHKSRQGINTWILSVVEDFVGEGSAMGIRIITELDDEIGEVDFDVEKMEVVLTNLLVNAIKHSFSGSEIIVKSKFITEDKKVRVEIIDRGPGLNGLSKEKLFTRFYQGSNEKYGTGIGLSYSKVLVELHNGIIGAYDNQDGSGATFFFEIPVNDETVMEEKPRKAYLNEILASEEEKMVDVSLQKEEKYNTENDVLLIVDDSVELLEFIYEALNGKFKSIYTASNGKEAIDVISKVMPNVVVSDVMMPEMNGYELCEYIKGKEDLCNIPVILLTARNEEQGKQYGYKLGADAFLAKPFEVDTLMEIIRSKLRSKEQAKQHYMHLSFLPEVDKMTLSNTDEAFLQKLNNVIRNNISNTELDINMICKEIGMSRASFYNKLKSIMDVSANEYINKIRLEHAIMLIKNSDLSFTEISEKTGFASSKYFSTSFKQYTGLTPTQYKKQCKKEVEGE